MTTTSTVTNPYTALNGTPAATTKAEDTAGSAERFLKLLVTQMQNQDPLNPMDNAQVTSQMAQINTVSGIDKLNTTVENLGDKFAQMQMLQGVSLVGRGAIVQGNLLTPTEAGGRSGMFELPSAVDSVKVEVLNSAGAVIDTLNLDAETAGRHTFEWPGKSTSAALKPEQGAAFRITAKAGASTVSATPLVQDRVGAVATGGGTMKLDLAYSGSKAYGDIVSFND